MVPVIVKDAPIITASIPSVTTKDGTLSTVTINPLVAPIKAPTRIAPKKATIGSSPGPTINQAHIP